MCEMQKGSKLNRIADCNMNKKRESKNLLLPGAAYDFYVSMFWINLDLANN